MYSNTNINNEKEESQNPNNDNSYIVLENILYCSSPKTGIKSKSNIENKNIICTPFSSGNDMYATHFTFNIFKEASTDVASKEEILNSHKNSNIISDFNKNLLLNKEEKEKNTKNNNNEDTEEVETKNYLEIKKCISMQKDMQKDNKKSNIKKYFSSSLNKNIFDKNNKIYNRRKKNNCMFLEESNNKDKNGKIKKHRYASIDYDIFEKNKKKKNVNSKNKISIFNSINYNDKNKKVTKSHFYEDELFLRNNKKNITESKKVLKDIKNKLKNKEIGKNKILKDKTIKNNKKSNNIKFAISLRNPSGKINNKLHLLESSDNLDKKRKDSNNSNNSLINNNDNIFDNNYISHPVKISKEELNENNLFLVKSTKYVNHLHRKFPLIKEVDRDYEKHLTKKIKSEKKPYKNFKKKNKKNKKNNTENKKANKIKGKSIKDVSKFGEIKADEEEEADKLKKILENKYSSNNIFRKAITKCIEKEPDDNNMNIFTNKKSAKCFIQLDKKKEKEKQYKLKSSIELNKKISNKKNIDTIKESQENNKLKRRHTIFVINDQNNKNNMMNNSDKNKNGNNSSFYSENDDNNEGITSNDESINVKKSEMKINKITEDKLILNYNNKNEIIDLLSDKENINNYYEYLDLCIDSLQEINLKDVPKSKVKVNFNFPKDRKNKKIALPLWI